MKKCLIISSASIVFLSILIFIFNRNNLLLADISVNGSIFNFDWQNYINVLYNTFFQWKSSDFIAFTSGILRPYLNNYSYAPFVASLVIIFSGALAYYTRDTDRIKFSHLLLAASVSTALLMIFNCDSIILIGFAFSFWMLQYCDKFLESPQMRNFEAFGYILFAFLLYSCANQAVFAIAFIVFGVSIFSLPVIPSNKRYVIIFTAGLFLLATVYAPVPVTPAYPPSAHVVPDDNIPGNIMPLVGPFTSIPVINRQSLKSLLYIPSAVIFICSLILWPLYRKTDRRTHFLMFLAVCCMLDSFFPEYISIISPLSAVTRVLPGLYYFPLLPLAIAGWIFTFSVVIADHGRHILAGASFLFFLGLFGIRVKPEVISQNVPRHILVSPSFNVIETSGASILKLYGKNLQFLKLTLDNFESITASGNDDERHISHLFDERDRTRWTMENGLQNGSEWIEFNFKTSRDVKGVHLSSGIFTADYPRGIEIDASMDCSNFFNIYQSPVWPGNISFTPDGYPYYESQSDVKIIFEHPVELKCMKIKQTGRSRYFDWSLAEFELIDY